MAYFKYANISVIACNKKECAGHAKAIVIRVP